MLMGHGCPHFPTIVMKLNFSGAQINGQTSANLNDPLLLSLRVRTLKMYHSYNYNNISALINISEKK